MYPKTTTFSSFSKKAARIAMMVFMAISTTVFSQTPDYAFVKTNDIVATDSLGNPYKFPWTGGMSYSQFSAVDLNADGIKDLVVFDKNGNRIMTFLNSGIADSISYSFAPEYALAFPEIHSWMQLIDFNYDGKEDIFTYSNGGIKVFKNTSTSSISFNLIKDPILSSYNGNYTNLFCLSEDYPAISDIDGDGDLDILNFWVLGRFVNYHKNLSIEKYGIPDSLDYGLTDESWGCFAEDEGSNVLMLDTCLNGSKSAVLKNFKHSGSTLLAEDFNGDGLKDLLIGDVDYSNLIKLTNTGTVTKAKMTIQDTMFPMVKPVNLYSFPLANYLDVTNDGKKDLLVSPFDPGLTTAESFKSNWLYKNQGTNNQPVFSFEQEDFLQKDMLDFGTAAFPVLYDIDNDGLKDLFVGNIGYRDTSYMQNGILQSVFVSKIAFFKNQGTLNNPVFKLISRNFASISALHLQGVYPAFGDLNNDGKAEMIIGNADGKLHLYTNMATVANPDFVLSQSTYQNIDVGEFSTPQLFDINKDGLLDLVIGERQNFWKDAANNIIARKGNLNYFKNTGTLSNPVFTQITDSLGGVDITNYNISNFGFSTPCLFRTSANETRLFVGNEEGKIYYYKNIDNNLNGIFSFTDTLSFVQGNTEYQITEGSRSGIAVADINNDGFLDAFIGNAAGGISFFKGSPLNTSIEVVVVKNDTDIEIYPNPCNDYFNIKFSNSKASFLYGIEIYDIYGKIKIKKTINHLTDFNINTSSLSQGIYSCRIYLMDSRNLLQFSVSKKLIINR